MGKIFRDLTIGRRSKCKFAVTVVSGEGYVHSAAFSEVAETLHFGLKSLGYDSVLTSKGALPGRRHIVLGPNLLPYYPLRLDADAILYNLEQVEMETGWFRPELKLIDIFRRHEVWDYSKRNALALEAHGVKVAHIVPVGYVKELTRLQRTAEPDIDVLFIGAMNPRRQRVIQEMRAAGLQVYVPFGVYGEERDALIMRAKLLLNVHFYEAKVLEIVRISYLLANRCTVLSERSADPSEDDELAGGVAFADYGDLVRRARELVDSPAERERMAQRGFELMRARPMEAYLRVALDQGN